MAEKKTTHRLTGGILVIVILAICLSITSYALVMASVSVDNNYFGTGTVKLNLNDGKPVIREDEYLFEPGMTVVKEFFLQNDSSDAVYYRLYLDEVSGGLADVLEITISEGDKVLYQGTASQLDRAHALAVDDVLALGQRREFTISFYFPREKGNETQNRELSFLLCADGAQIRNNPDKQF